ncbi:MAG: hypothetical protein JO028_02115 [Acidobacteriaceae bacterium]|nr:hypothetical protein [Acidobacteriaceae bacterium]
MKLHIHGFWVPLLLAGFAGGAFQSELKDAKPVQTYSIQEAYKVYSAVLPDEWTWRYANSKILLIKAETVPYQMCLTPDAESAKLLDPAIVNFRIVNGTTWTLERKLDISKPYELVPGAALQAPFKTNGPAGWSDFKREHPDSVGWIELSAVGFNHDKTVAIVYIGHHCGGLCGGGGFRVLRKSEGKWKGLAWNGGSCAWAS